MNRSRLATVLVGGSASNSRASGREESSLRQHSGDWDEKESDK